MLGGDDGKTMGGGKNKAEDEKEDGSCGPAGGESLNSDAPADNDHVKEVVQLLNAVAKNNGNSIDNQRFINIAGDEEVCFHDGINVSCDSLALSIRIFHLQMFVNILYKSS